MCLFFLGLIVCCLLSAVCCLLPAFYWLLAVVSTGHVREAELDYRTVYRVSGSGRVRVCAMRLCGSYTVFVTMPPNPAATEQTLWLRRSRASHDLLMIQAASGVCFTSLTRSPNVLSRCLHFTSLGVSVRLCSCFRLRARRRHSFGGDGGHQGLTQFPPYMACTVM